VPGDYVMLAVSDDGIGMDKETLTNVFEPFFTTKEVGKGTGLGLSTVYGIVKQNNGYISAYSEPQKGTTFKVYLPRHKGEVRMETETARTEPRRSHGETLLIVEDDPSVLKLGQLILEQLGYSVLASQSPLKAVEMVQEYTGEIHLLITDVVMPSMSGKDLSEEISRIRPEIKILFMSGYAANPVAHQDVLDESVHFIQKPFSIDSMALKVREVLDGE
jgi:two-component system, cell cycle sensor histidine kinase and response regulator CckA